MPILSSQSAHASAVYADMMKISHTIDSSGYFDYYPQAIIHELQTDPKYTGEMPDHMFIGAVAIDGIKALDGAAPDIDDVLSRARHLDEIDMWARAQDVEADCRTMFEFQHIDGCEPVVRKAAINMARGLFDILIAAMTIQMSHERAQCSTLRARIGD